MQRLIIFLFLLCQMIIYIDAATKQVENKLQNKAEEIKKYMKSNVDPCENFYEYACGNWARAHPADFVVKTGIFQVLEDAYNVEAKRLLKELNVQSQNKMERKVKTFYNSCLNRTEMRKNYTQKLSSIMEEFGGMPALKGDEWQEQAFDWLEVVAKILRKYGKQIIIGVDVSADMRNSSINRIHLGEIQETISSKVQWYYSSLESKYKRDMESIFKINHQLSAETAKQIANFKRSLAEGISEPLDGVLYHEKAKLRTLDEMSTIYGPTLNFTRFVSIWLGSDYKLPVYEYVESYLVNLKKLIEKTPKSVVANFIMWELIEDFRFEAAYSDEDQDDECVKATKKHFLKYLDHSMYHELMKTEKNKNINANLQQLFDELKHNFAEILQSNSSSWLSVDSRQHALTKLAAMSLELNSYENEDFEQKYGAEELNDESYFQNVVKVLNQRGRYLRDKVTSPPKLDSEKIVNFTPAYSCYQNKIFIPVAFLHPRFLGDSSYPAALNYATAGFVIGHEIVHGFDDNLRQYDARGNLADWWDTKSSEEFLKRKECLSVQYSGFKYAGTQLPKSNAQDENIADIVGLRIAYRAFKSWLSQQSENDVVLPDLNLTPEKLFFLALAQVWCTDVYFPVRSILAQLDVHAPEEIRVQGMMSNFDAFSKEFQCKPEAKMNIQEKCKVY